MQAGPNYPTDFISTGPPDLRWASTGRTWNLRRQQVPNAPTMNSADYHNWSVNSSLYAYEIYYTFIFL